MNRWQQDEAVSWDEGGGLWSPRTETSRTKEAPGASMMQQQHFISPGIFGVLVRGYIRLPVELQANVRARQARLVSMAMNHL